MQRSVDKVRIDKWLWAARFFKTRSLAKAAIEGGKVKVNGQRVKPSREIGVGVTLEIRQGWDDKVVEVISLSEERRGAPEAAQLYNETDDSLRRRTEEAERRRQLRDSFAQPAQRPNKRQRRLIHRFLHQDDA